ncbi:MAG: peroxide stress protein YaaA [Bacilli bacterium]
MKILLSPSMTMSNKENKKLNKTLPIFHKKTNEIIRYLRSFTIDNLQNQLMLKANLTNKVFDMYKNFDSMNIKEVQALAAYKGLVYKNINISDFDEKEIKLASENIRILSALYGVLKPTDLIHEYRLDFKSPFSKNGIYEKNLYKFWDTDIYNEIFKNNEIVINLCSNEYEKLILPYLKSNDKFITCKFLINNNGNLKSQAMFSKIARGQMVRFIIKNNINKIENIKEFSFDNFKFSQKHSNNNTIVFIRN